MGGGGGGGGFVLQGLQRGPVWCSFGVLALCFKMRGSK